MVAAGIVILLVAAVISAVNVDRDTGSDLLATGRAVLAGVARLRWQFVVVVVALAGLHYAATAVAARAASGLPLPIGETLLVQLAAAAANRVTPAGLGGSAVTVRYFHRRGLAGSAAIGAVAMLSVVAAVGDFMVLLILVVLGRWLGLSGASHELAAVVVKATHLLAPLRSAWLWVALLVGVLIVLRLRRAGHHQIWVGLWRPLRELVRDRRAATILLVASSSTTLILGFAFVCSVGMVPGPRPDLALGGLLVAFMLASAAGNAVPVPAGLGSTEAALVGVLVSAGVSTGSAVQQVLIFRLLTFWLPALVGVFATTRLRRRSAL